ncbi:hypothetical protein AOX55_00006634 (plasmid) [Sinorhizobium fredii CCBAU 25509]|nr:hypothetical protein SF83666_b67680 [Sinorhizobium fredii CCBAU 83666]AWM29409.1 hypothetical protein AOX55_00006634 [Sinorhizobium fredii CCBAU 25509]
MKRNFLWPELVELDMATVLVSAGMVHQGVRRYAEGGPPDRRRAWLAGNDGEGSVCA